MSGILASGELTVLRTVASASLPDTCTIKRLNSTVGTSACRLENAVNSARVQNVLSAMDVAAPAWTVLLPTTADVRQSDWLVIGSQTFEITVPFGPQSDEILRQVGVVQVKNAQG